MLTVCEQYRVSPSYIVFLTRVKIEHLLKMASGYAEKRSEKKNCACKLGNFVLFSYLKLGKDRFVVNSFQFGIYLNLIIL